MANGIGLYAVHCDGREEVSIGVHDGWVRPERIRVEKGFVLCDVAFDGEDLQDGRWLACQGMAFVEAVDVNPVMDMESHRSGF